MDQEQVKKLISELQDGTDRQRRAASFKLRKFKDTEVIQALINAYTDTDISVRQNAIEGLQIIGTDEAQEFLNSQGQSIKITKFTRKNSVIKKIAVFGIGIDIVGILVGYFLVMEYQYTYLIDLMGFITAFIAVIFSYIIGKRETKGNKTRLAVLPYIIFGLIAATIPYYVGIMLISATCVFGC